MEDDLSGCVVELLLHSAHSVVLKLGFDATTQECVHINSVHITDKANCYVISIEQLPGGMAEDYHTHI